MPEILEPSPMAQRSDAVDFDTFRTLVSRAVVPLDVHTAEPDSFRGTLDTGGTGDVHLFRLHTSAHAVNRTPGLIARAPQHTMKFTIMEQGRGFLVQDGREATLRPGDMAIYDADRPYSLLFDDTVRMSVVMFPKAMLDTPAEVLSTITATRLDSTHGVGALLRPYVLSLAEEMAEVDGHVARRLFRSAIDMVGTLLDAHLPASTPSSRSLLLRRILDHIDENLHVSGLNPAQIAAAHFISVRHLHGLFSEQGMTVSTIIRTRRLERCYDELLNPRNADRSVASIAFDHGFIDAAHFSRVFRAHFGVAPSSVRGER